MTELVALYKNCISRTSVYRLSEIDTQVLFVEPILERAGWDIKNPLAIRRANRDNQSSHFDIEAYLDFGGQSILRLAIECKSIHNSEYNIDRLLTGGNIGALISSNNGWKNRDKDGVGQIRKYCLSYMQFEKNRTIPIITNGFSWTIFRTENFLNSERLGNPIEDNDILTIADISNPLDFNRILKYIQKQNNQRKE